jgi:8-amino-7-oxononanoate synthase
MQLTNQQEQNNKIKNIKFLSPTFVGLFILINSSLAKFLSDKINERIKTNSLRELKFTDSNLIDFSSNDYLGFAQSTKLKSLLQEEVTLNPEARLGSTGSRLISGNTKYIEDLESCIADFHQAQAGLIFSSGYDANVGLLSSIANRNDTFICDELIHASLIDGVRLSKANKFTFKHNNLASLEDKLKLAKGNVFIVTESVFSMDGDFAPLIEILNLTNQYNAYLIVDEAHATGVIGKKGEGLVQSLNLQNQVFARIATFGKAIGSHGAIVLGSEILRTFLINFARSFIYTTAPSFHNLAVTKNAYQYINEAKEIEILQNNIAYFNSKINNQKQQFIASESAIQSLLISGNTECKNAAALLKENGFDVKAILSPTVPLGKERIRICLHAYNTEKEIDKLLNTINNL